MAIRPGLGPTSTGGEVEEEEEQEKKRKKKKRKFKDEVPE
jgi:hypothetical protein